MPSQNRYRIPISRLLIMGGVVAAALPLVLLVIGYTLNTRDVILATTLQNSERAAAEASDYINQLLVDRRAVLNLAATELGADGLDLTTTSPVLDGIRENFPLFQRVLLVLPDGIVRIASPSIAENGQSITGTNVSDRDYVQVPLKTREPYVDPDVLVGKTTGVPIVVMSAPVIGPDGQVQGVLAGVIDLKYLTELTGRMHFGETGHAVVVTAAGTTVANQDLDLVLGRFDFSQQAIWSFLEAGERGQIREYADENGRARFGAFATVPVTGWKVWLSQEYDELDAQFFDLALASSIWPLAALLAGIVLSVLLSRVIARPVENLQRTAEEIAAGQLERRAPEEGPAELASLAGAINVMAESLQQRIADERNARAAIESTVTEYSRFAQAVAGGDFSAELSVANAGDLERLGRGLNGMSRSLGLLVGEIKTATAQIGSATAEILAATSQQAAATSEEAAAVRQMASSVHELRQAGDSVARRTQTVVDMALRTEAVADSGLQSVEETIRQVEEGRARLETLAERVMSFSERTHEIAEINATVSELAEKSNLLAVNASIEAAKAGEAGRGFAVVANEVKELAEQSKAATSQVRRIIADIQRSAQAAVIGAEQYAKASGASVAASRQSGSAISTLAERVTEASQAAKQNLAAAEQQQAGIEQIALAVDNIETSSNQTVSATSQVEQSARSLHDLALSLEAIVGKVAVKPDEDREA